jgi:hypothetical protein
MAATTNQVVVTQTAQIAPTGVLAWKDKLIDYAMITPAN